MIVADASVLIAQLDARDVHHEAATELLVDLAAHPLLASTVTVAETLVGPARAGRLAEARAALDRLGLQEVGFGDEDAAERLARLRAGTTLRMPDCCVLLAAQTVPEAIVATFDERLRSEARSLGLAVA